MAKQRLTFTLADEVVNAIDAAGKEVWTELDGNRSALASKIIIEYSRGRSNGGGKTAKVEKEVKRLAEQMEMLQSDMALIKKKLGIEYYDTDHA